jgi:hypothetical protein
MCLKEHRAANARFDGQHGGVEAFQMAGLQNAAVTLGARNQVVSLSEGRSKRLFNEKIKARVEQLRRHGVVMHGWHSDTRRIEVEIGGEQFVDGIEDRNTVLRGRVLRALRIGLNSSNQHDAEAGSLQFAKYTKMVAPEGTRAGNGDSQAGLAGYCAASLEPPATALRQRR